MKVYLSSLKTITPRHEAPWESECNFKLFYSDFLQYWKSVQPECTIKKNNKNQKLVMKNLIGNFFFLLNWNILKL